MKTMKSLIVAFALLVGMVGLSHASRSNGGWKAYTVNASSAQVFVGAGFLNSISLSTGCTQNVPGVDWAIAFDTVAISTTTGLTWVNSTNYAAYLSTFLPMAAYPWNTSLTNPQVTPPLLFGSTTTAASGAAANGYWSSGQGEDDYEEIVNGLFILKSGVSTGLCNQAVIYYSK